jgi:TPR repeat protein
MYRDGEGVSENFITAYTWYNIAAAQEYVPAVTAMADIAKKMTPAQIAVARKLSKEMVEKNPKLLK